MQIRDIFPGARRMAAEFIIRYWKAVGCDDRRTYYVRQLENETTLHIPTMPMPPPGGRVALDQWATQWTWPPRDVTTDDVARHNAAVREFYLLMGGRHIPDSITQEALSGLPSLRVKAKFPHAKPTYGGCGICGHRPRAGDAPNTGPVKWYDPDDGIKLGTLCPGCLGDVVLNERTPDAGDFCMRGATHPPIIVDTDECVISLMEE